MKATLYVALISLLVSLPAQVFAQAVPEAAAGPDVSVAPYTGLRPVAVDPAMSPGAASLWSPSGRAPAAAAAEPLSDLAPVDGWSEWSTEKRVWVVGGIAVGLMLLGVLSLG